MAEQQAARDPLPEGARRLGLLEISPEALAALLGLREGVAVVDIRRDLFEYNALFKVLIEGPTLPIVQLGGMVPVMSPDTVRA